jgi:hypothetical protein
MGYRHYFFLVDKKDVERVKDKTYDELVEIARDYGVEIEDEDGESYFYFNDRKFMNKTEIYEFGKLYWDDTADRIYSKGVPLFENAETQKCFYDYCPYVMGQDAMLEAIDIYKGKIINYYKSLIVDGDTKEFSYFYDIEPDEIKNVEVTRHITDILYHWDRMGVIDTDLDHERISSSWMYEHQIFELVRLYKSIDWRNKCLLFYGW